MPQRTPPRADSAPAHLWVRETSDGPGDWTATPLAGDRTRIAPLLDVQRAGSGVWVAVGPPAVHVNGGALDLGIHVLRDRDELRHGNARVFFSTESLPEVASFPGAEQPAFCPRCKLEILAAIGSGALPAVRRVAAPHGRAAVWTYADHCTLCDQPSALDGGFRWAPEEL